MPLVFVLPSATGWALQPADPAVFYLCFNTYDGFSYYYLPGACFLEKYEEVYMGGEKKSLVLSYKIIKGCKFLQPLHLQKKYQITFI